jgi:hypothetical protein
MCPTILEVPLCCKRAAAFLLVICLSTSLPAQGPAPGRPKPSSPGPLIEKGFVEDKKYKNSSIGVEITPAPKLRLEVPELKGVPGTVPLLVTVSAWGEQKGLSARDSMTFYAEASAYYPEGRRSTEAYMRRVVRANEEDGFEVLQASLGEQLGGVAFARTDFKRGLVYEAVLVSTCEALALVFIYTSSGLDEVNGLIRSTDLKLDLAKSGCGAKPTGTAKQEN